MELDRVVLAERLEEGQNVRAYRVEAWAQNTWRTVAHGSTIGHKKIEVFPALSTTKVRVVVEKSIALRRIWRP